MSGKFVLIVALFGPLGCGGRAAHADGPFVVAGAANVGSSESAGASGSSISAGSSNSSNLAGSSNASPSGGAGGLGSASDPGRAAELDAGSVVGPKPPAPLDAGALNADALDAGVIEPNPDAGAEEGACHNISRDISCIKLAFASGEPPQNVCAFSPERRACNADADCGWVLVPDCCCTVPRYVFDPSTLNEGACSAQSCTGGYFVID